MIICVYNVYTQHRTRCLYTEGLIKTFFLKIRSGKKLENILLTESSSTIKSNHIDATLFSWTKDAQFMSYLRCVQNIVSSGFLFDFYSQLLFLQICWYYCLLVIKLLYRMMCPTNFIFLDSIIFISCIISFYRPDNDKK